MPKPSAYEFEMSIEN